MARSVLELVIKFMKEGDADKETVRALVNVKGSITQVMGAMAAFAAAGYAVERALSAVVAAAREGAELDYERQRFDRLAVSIGTTADLLLSEMTEATRGTLSQFQAMRAASDLLALGLAKNQQEAIRLATVQAGLGMNMNQLVLTLTNQTTMRFDALGVSVDGFKEKVNALKQSGMDANAAFREAFLQQAEAQLLKVGNAADTAAGDWKRFDAEIANSTDQLKLYASEAVSPLAGALADMMAAQRQANEAVEDAGWIIAQSGSYYRGVSVQIQEYHEWLDRGRAATEFYSRATQGLNVELEDEAALLEMNKQAFSDLSTMVGGDLGKAYDDHIQKIADLNAEMETARSAKDREGIQAQIDAETAAYERQTNAILYNIQSQIIMRTTNVSDEEKLAALTQLADAYGLIDAKTSSAVGATNTLVGAWLAGAMTTDELIDRLGELGSKTGATASQIHLAAEYSDDQKAATKNVGDASKAAIEPVDGFAGSMNQVGKDADYAAGEINQVISQAKALNGMVSVVTIVINTIGEMPSFGNNKGKGGLAVATGGSFGSGFYSAGGQWAPGEWAIVGDMPGGGIGPYTESIDPWGYIHSARETRALMAMGLLEGAKSLYAPEGSGTRLDKGLFFPGRNQPGRDPGDLVRQVRSSTGSAGLGSLGGGETASLADVVGTLEQSAASTSQAAFAASRSADMQAQQSATQTDVLQSGNEAIVSELQELRRDLPAALKDAVKLVV